MTMHDDEQSRLIDEVNLELFELREAADRLDEAAAATYSLNRTDLRCLGIIYRHGRVTAGELAEEGGLSPGAVTTVLDRLERGGYATRVGDPLDRRRVLVASTAFTREIGARVYGQVELAGREELERRTTEDLVVIRDYLRRARMVYENQATQIAAEAAQGSGGDVESESRAGQREFAGPLGDVTEGRLEFARGAARVEIHAAPGMKELYRARFEGVAPEVKVREGIVMILQKRRFGPFDWRKQASDVALNAAIPWRIGLRGGLWKLRADLSGLSLISLEVTGGSSDVEITLPAPAGAVPVKISGGASKVTLHRPAGTAVRADISGGAGTLAFDGQKLSGLGGRNRLESEGFAATNDRYEIRLQGGANAVTIDAI